MLAQRLHMSSRSRALVRECVTKAGGPQRSGERTVVPGRACHRWRDPPRYCGRIRSVTGSFGVVLFSSVRHGSLAGLPKPAIFFAPRSLLGTNSRCLYRWNEAVRSVQWCDASAGTRGVGQPSFSLRYSVVRLMPSSRAVAATLPSLRASDSRIARRVRLSRSQGG